MSLTVPLKTLISKLLVLVIKNPNGSLGSVVEGLIISEISNTSNSLASTSVIVPKLAMTSIVVGFDPVTEHAKVEANAVVPSQVIDGETKET